MVRLPTPAPHSLAMALAIVGLCMVTACDPESTVVQVQGTPDKVDAGATDYGVIIPLPDPCKSAADCPKPDVTCLLAACGNNGKCFFGGRPDGTPCSDDDACTAGDVCAVGKCTSGPPAQCDDGNVCTTDDCAPALGCFYAASDAPCEIADLCTAHVCSGGACKVGDGSPCDDGNPCTADGCDPKTGCVHGLTAAECDDGSLCTAGDHCEVGECAGKAIVCNDGNPCTDDGCAPATGCHYTNNTAPCTDNNACTSGDKCAKGACLTQPLDCDDANVCTSDSCAPKSGCQHVKTAASCSDGSACTVADQCNDGGCKPGPSADCDDGNACTDDGCDAKMGCSHADAKGPCKEADLCGSYTCQGGACKATGDTKCADGNPCTIDGCLPQKGCVWSFHTGACDDGNACSQGDACKLGKCIPGPATDCDDGALCTTDGCVDNTGCIHSPNVLPCDDANACTEFDACSGGICVAKPVTCDDKVACTTNSCDASQGCVYGPDNGACDDGKGCTNDVCNGKLGCLHFNNQEPCNDGDACTAGDACEGGKCKSGSPLNCDDSNPCVSVACHEVKGCVLSDKAGACDDKNACTKADACVAGGCVGVKVSCDDKAPCTTDSCTSDKGCQHAFNTAPCSDGDACTKGDTCGKGKCVSGAGLSCKDGNGCTDDGCDVAKGCVFKANVAPCDDGSACTTKDTCAGGKCVGKTLDCDDKDKCTSDSCDPKKGCEHYDETAKCKDDNDCTDDGCVPAKGCQYVPNKGNCDDGSACTDNDACAAGKCVGAKVDCDDADICSADTCEPANGCQHAPDVAKCDDANLCTDDSCEPAKGCKHSPNVAGCDDGDVCTAPDNCKSGACGAGDPVDCGDNNGCTVDSCDAKAGCGYKPVADGTPCEDGTPCTKGDQCGLGQCVPGPAAYCPGNPCKGKEKLVERTFGGGVNDTAQGVAVLADGGFALVGLTGSKGAGKYDYWLVRTDHAGDLLFDQTYGGTESDEARAVAALPDASFAIAGMSQSKGTHGGRDFWVVRTDAKGKAVWSEFYGSVKDEYAESIVALADGGFAVLGHSEAVGSKWWDMWVVRTDKAGKQLWTQSYGGVDDERGHAVAVLADGGLALAGYTGSKGAGKHDMWLLRTDKKGKTLWDATYGGKDHDEARSVAALPGGFVLAGMTRSKGAGNYDFWLVRTDDAGKAIWDHTYGGKDHDEARGLAVVPQGGFALVGYTESAGAGFADMWLVRTDLYGNTDWQQTYGGGAIDEGRSVTVFPDGNFALTGFTTSSGNGLEDFWLVRVDAWGHDDCEEAGGCSGKLPDDCDDGQACTGNDCVSGKLCSYEPHADGALCGDGKVCKSNVCQ